MEDIIAARVYQVETKEGPRPISYSVTRPRRRQSESSDKLWECDVIIQHPRQGKRVTTIGGYDSLHAIYMSVGYVADLVKTAKTGYGSSMTLDGEDTAFYELELPYSYVNSTRGWSAPDLTEIARELGMSAGGQ